MYHLVAGRSPFRSTNDDSPAAVLMRILREEPPPLPPDVPGDLNSTLAGALAKDPSARPTSAATSQIACRRSRPIRAGRARRFRHTRTTRTSGTRTIDSSLRGSCRSRRPNHSGRAVPRRRSPKTNYPMRHGLSPSRPAWHPRSPVPKPRTMPPLRVPTATPCEARRSSAVCAAQP